jgi:chemotaxis regulatin CheY-phosphate phosphatase CheZ
VTGQVVESILDIARAVTQELENDPNFLTNAEKRQAAFERIKNKALEEGKQVSSHAINLAIELAVAELRT